MKKLKVFLVILLVFLLSGCGAETGARRDFENMMNAFKTADKTKINRYYDMAKISAFLDGDFSAELFKTLKQMDYRVISSKKTDDGAVKLNVEITTLDFSKIVSDYLIKVEELISSSAYKQSVKHMLDEEYQETMSNLMVESINECEEKTSKTIEVIMVKTEDGSYRTDGNSNEFLSALFEDLGAAVESFT